MKRAAGNTGFSHDKAVAHGLRAAMLACGDLYEFKPVKNPARME